MSEPVWWRRAPGPRGITRHFVVDAIRWRAFEFATRFHPIEISLVFACDTAWRRLIAFPADWAVQEDAALIELSGVA